MRKTRSDSMLLSLPEGQQAQLAEWLLSNVPYHRAQELVEKEFGVTVKSLTSFSRFWEAVCLPVLLRRRARAVSTAEEVASEAAARPGRLDAATIDALKQKAFELSISPGADPDAVRSVFSLVLKARDQDLDAQKLKLDWEKFSFDAAKRAMEALEELKAIRNDSSLNTEEKLARARTRLFGERPEASA